MLLISALQILCIMNVYYEFGQYRPAVLFNHKQIQPIQTKHIDSVSSSFIFHYMFRPYILTIIRYKITGTEVKELQKRIFHLHPTSTLCNIRHFFYLITLFHSKRIYETPFRTPAAVKSNTRGSITRHIPYEQSPASCCTTHHLAFLPTLHGPYFTLLAPNQDRKRIRRTFRQRHVVVS